MKKRVKDKPLARWQSPRPPSRQGCLRIIGGDLRGRQIAYAGDARTRPMKDNIREAVFNLIGAWVPGKLVFDLFSGTGAIGLEAISRGATRATLIERHIPTARLIEQNSRELGVEDRCQVICSDTFFWARRFVGSEVAVEDRPWAVFCSPPYDCYVDREAEMVNLIDGFVTAAPPGSLIVVESDDRFAMRRLADAENWRIRRYSPAQIGVLKIH